MLGIFKMTERRQNLTWHAQLFSKVSEPWKFGVHEPVQIELGRTRQFLLNCDEARQEPVLICLMFVEQTHAYLEKTIHIINAHLSIWESQGWSHIPNSVVQRTSHHKKKQKIMDFSFWKFNCGSIIMKEEFVCAHDLTQESWTSMRRNVGLTLSLNHSLRCFENFLTPKTCFKASKPNKTQSICYSSREMQQLCKLLGKKRIRPSKASSEFKEVPINANIIKQRNQILSS